MKKYNQVIIWGHKIGSHTHSWIHHGFYRAFKHLGYNVLWLDNKDNIYNIDLTRTIFITEHQVDQKIPIRNDCKYILHNSFIDAGKGYYLKNAGTWEDRKYIPVSKLGNVINMQVYKTKFVEGKTKMDDYIYYNLDTYTLYMPWATDLLPYEIDENKMKVSNILKNRKNEVNLVGTMIPEWDGFKRACRDNKMKFKMQGGFSKNVSMEKNIELIQKSYMAPAIQITDQVNRGYIPCRIFKNLSYGHMGVTNSKVVYELFDKNIVYDVDTYKLYQKAEKCLKREDIEERILNLMDFVKMKHTYLNRIESIFKYFDIIEDFNKKHIGEFIKK